MTVSRGKQREAGEGLVRTDGSVVLQRTQISHRLYIRIDEHGHQPLLLLERQRDPRRSTRLNALEDDALGDVGDVGDNDAAKDHLEDSCLSAWVNVR